MRVCGGIEQHPHTRRYALIVHLWDEDAGLGDPVYRFEWPDTYVTEAEAETAYLEHIRPALAAIRQRAERTPGGRVDVQQWGFRPREETR
jgi:hypothetical protein